MELKNHPDKFLNDDAAASLERLENDHGVQPITDAGRTKAKQQELIDAWNRGGPENRPPNLYEPARPAERSSHVKNGGEAVDVINWRWWRENAAEYGWIVDYDWDVVHFRYDITKDQHLNRVAGTITQLKNGTPMNYIRISGITGKRRGGTYAVFQTAEGGYLAVFVENGGPNNLEMITHEGIIGQLSGIIQGLS